MTIRHLIHEIFSITWGNHVWKGAIPALIARDKKIIVFKVSNDKILVSTAWIEAEKISKIDAMACAKKYIIADSVDLKFSSLKIIGINLIKLISSPIHLVNQELDDTAVIVPNIIKAIKIIWKFFKNIKEEEIW